jgi:UDP-N-acetylmuramate--alanine ligase
MKHLIESIHFIGIGGSGMSGIAEVLHTLGYQISGSDLNASSTTARLQALGIQVNIGHAASHIGQAQVIVVSSAIDNANPEIMAAKAKHLPIVPRAVMLAELMRFKQGIAIAGTHGKTTTTSLVTSILHQAGLDPTFVIGGKLNAAGANAKLGKGDFLVAEADESDASFLNLSPIMQVITNIDMDHMITYNHDFNQLKQAFIDFVHKMPFYGQLVACIDDANVQSILPKLSRTVISYGLHEDAMYRAQNIQAGTAEKAGSMQFTVLRHDDAPLNIELNLAGQHNVLNALASIAIASELGVEDAAIIEALKQFKGVGRRFQRYTFKNIADKDCLLIDDYGHHPVELNATLNAVKGAYPEKELVLIFQPHRYTRTRDCFDEFVQVLSRADKIILLPVYAASEAPIAQADSKALARSLRLLGKEPLVLDDLTAVKEFLKQHSHEGQVILSMGAGSVGQLPALMQA